MEPAPPSPLPLHQQGSKVAGFLVGFFFGLLGIIIAFFVAKPVTKTWTLIGLAGRVVVAVCLVGLGLGLNYLFSKPVRVEEAACACSVEAPRSMTRARDLNDQAELQLANRVSELYFIDMMDDKATMVPTTLPLLAERMALFQRGVSGDALRDETPFEPVTINGRDALRRTFILDDPEDPTATAYMIEVLVDTPQRYHHLMAWTLLDQRSEHEGELEAIIQSFQDHGTETETRWALALVDGGLSEGRKGIEPARREPPWIREPAPRPPERLFERIRYKAPLGENVAYLTPDPKDGQRHPAVLWAHGGFGGIDSWLWEPAPLENDQTASAFRRAGVVMMIPSWRGENDNPGQFELFYGEVDDLLAARDHLASLPYVDPERIYLAGHSTGGTLVLLAAAATDGFRAAFSFGGMVNLRDAEFEDVATPFDTSDHAQADPRSAFAFTRGIRRPTFYFEGQQSGLNTFEPRAMAAIAEASGVPFKAWILPGQDHFALLRPLTRGLAQKILADTDLATPFAISDDEVSAWLAAAHEPEEEATEVEPAAEERPAPRARPKRMVRRPPRGPR